VRKPFSLIVLLAQLRALLRGERAAAPNRLEIEATFPASS
jgi:DNA-binding response OmpR family regulator